MSIVAASTDIASGSTCITGHLVGISTCEVRISEVSMTIAGYNAVIALGEMIISLFYAAISTG
jgi:hypothetical protein